MAMKKPDVYDLGAIVIWLIGSMVAIYLLLKHP